MKKIILLSRNIFSSKHINMGFKTFTLSSRFFCVALLTAVFALQFQHASAQAGAKPGQDQIDQMVQAANNAGVFIENKGQWPAHVLYRADMPGGQMLATPEGMLVGKFDIASLQAANKYDEELEEVQNGKRPGVTVADLGPAPPIKGHGWKFNFIGGKKADATSINRKGESRDYYNYLVGDPSQFATDVHSYEEITYKGVYPGVDVRYYTGGSGMMENDIVVSPGADAHKIALQIEGIEELHLNAHGDIVLPTTIGEFNVPTPVSYLKDANGKRTPISLTYTLTGKNTLAFNIPGYDKSQTLVIDPIVMRWATWVSGNTGGTDAHCHGIDIDSNGYIYVTGKYGTNLVIVGGFQSIDSGNSSSSNNHAVFIGKYQEPATPGNPGSRIWQTYMGSSGGDDNPYALNVGPDQLLYLCGITSGNMAKKMGTGGPTPNWANQRTNGPGSQGWVAKVDSGGKWAMVHEIGAVSNNFGPTLWDLRILPTTGNNFDLVVAGSVTERTLSADGDIPAVVTPTGAAKTGTGDVNGYAFRMKSDLSAFVWTQQYSSTGTNSDQFNIALVDGSGNVYMGGFTKGGTGISQSNPSGQTTLTGTQDGWLMYLKGSDGTVTWSRYFNGTASATNSILCMEFDRTKSNIVLGGTTTGLATVNKTTPRGYGGSGDFFIASIKANGSATNWGTYYGGNQQEYNMMGLNIDQNNDVYILGYTYSKNIPTVDFPLQDSAYNISTSDRQGIFFKLSGSTGDTTLYLTFMGGNSDDYDPLGERGIKFNNCRIYLAVSSASKDFPLTQNTLTATKASSTGTLEPLIMSMANPPDLQNNDITSGRNQTLNCGTTPANLVGTVPNYIIPSIIRNSTVESNNTVNAFPYGVPPISSFQWQISYDSGQTWTNNVPDVVSTTGQSLTFTGPLGFAGLLEYRRIINDDACNRVGDTLSVALIFNSPTHPAPTTTPPAPICAGQSVTVNASTLDTGAQYFVWIQHDGVRDTVAGFTLTNAQSIDSGIWSVYTVNRLGCPSYPDSINVVIESTPPAPTLSSNSPVCSGDTIKLFASIQLGATITWTGPDTFNRTAVNPIRLNATLPMGGTYFAVQSIGTCNSPSGSTPVVVNATPLAPTAGATLNPACSGQTVGLTASPSGATSYSWTGPLGFTSNSQNPSLGTVIVADSGVYCVTQTSSLGCTSGKGCFDLAVDSTPHYTTVTPTNPTVCGGTDGKITISGLLPNTTYSVSYTLSGAVTTLNILSNGTGQVIITGLGSGSYSNISVSLNGCQSPVDAGPVVIFIPPPPPAPGVSNNSPVCQGDTIKLFATGQGGATFNWSGPNGFSNASQNPTIPHAIVTDSGEYCATQTVLGCVSPQACTDVVMHALPVITTAIGTNPTTCGGNNGFITVNGLANNTSYTVSYFNGTSTVVVTRTTNGSGSLTIINLPIGTYSNITVTLNGCTSSSAGPVTLVNPTGPNPANATTNAPICAGNALTLNVTATVGGAYVWSGPLGYSAGIQNPTVSASATTLMSGTYKVTVTLNGCSDSGSVAVVVNPNPTASAGRDTGVCSGMPIRLGGSPTGSGGTGTLSFNWSNGAGTNANPTVTPGIGTITYTVTVSDINLCSATANVTDTVRANPVANAGDDTTLVACSLVGVNLGGNPTATGGSGFYTYLWTPTAGLSSSTASNPNVSGIGSTTPYTVVVTDSRGCTATDGVLITVSSSSLQVNITPDSSHWCASSGGSALLTANATGGTPGYSYVWSGSNLTTTTLSTTTANPNVSGTYNYSVIVTDATGCQIGASAEITVNALPSASAGPDNGFTTCSGTPVAIGGSPTAAGGTPGYTYLWNNGSTSSNPTVTVLNTTPFSVVVTDANSCTASASVTVNVNQLPVVSAGPNVTIPTCSNTGTTIGGNPTASGGGGGFLYVWSPTTGLSSQFVANPTVVLHTTGTTTYTVTVTDANTCSASASMQVTVINNTPAVTIGSSVTPQWCAGSNGSTTLTANVTNGSPTYSYSWSGTDLTSFNTQSTIANPDIQGTYNYSVTVTDSFTCTATATIAVVVDTLPIASAGPQGGFTTCHGTADTIGGNPTASGGSGPYTYAWDNGAGTSPNPIVNPSGTTTYTVTVTDADGCTATSSTTLNVLLQPTASAGPNVTLPSCSPTGIQIGGNPTGSGGNGGPYNYLWSPTGGLSSSTAGNPTVQGINTSTVYTVTVTDGAGCTASASVSVTVTTNTPSTTISVTGPSSWCANSGGSSTLTANTTNSTLPFTYSWSGSFISPTNTQVVTVDPNGQGSYIYNVTVTDAFGCTSTATQTIVVDTLPTVNAGPNGGFNVCNGSPITIGGSPTGSGPAPITYVWSNGSTSGNPSVSPNQTTTYFVTVTDGQACSASGATTVNVLQTPVAIAGQNQNMTTCSLDSVILGGHPAAQGGVPPYKYSWSPALGLNNDTLANPVVKGITSSQTYTLVVTDSDGCSASSTVTVNIVPSTLGVSLTSSTLSSCGGGSSCVQLGGLPSTGINGAPPYTYAWSESDGGILNNPTSSNPVACPINSTTYVVTVTDSKGCTATATQVVLVDSGLVANAGADRAICLGTCTVIGGSPTASGGTPGYTYTWSQLTDLELFNDSNPTACPTAGTTWQLTVTDSKGCTATAQVIVSVNPDPIANAGLDVQMTSCADDSARLGGSPTASGSPGPYTYLWSPTNNLSCTTCSNPYVKGLTSNTSYEVVVTDSNGCSAEDAVNVFIIPTSLQANAGNNQSFCSNGTIPLTLGGNPTATGGIGPYTYSWAGPGFTSTLANPTLLPTAGGTYTVTVSDTKGCSATASVVISFNAAPTANAGTDTSICYNSCVTLGGSPSATGGSGSYQYNWSPTTGLNSNNSANPLACSNTSTTYVLTVTDGNGCTATSSIAVTVLPQLFACAGPDQQLTSCNSDSVHLGCAHTGSGGTPGYTYQWAPTAGLSCTNCANPWLSGITTTRAENVTVTDAHGCTAVSSTAIVVVPSTLSADAGNGGSYCAGSGGSVTLGGNPTAVGGSPSYTYTWSPSGSGPNPVVSPTNTTTFYVTVTDTKGCIAVDSATVVVNPTPTANAGHDTAVCGGSAVTIGGNPTATGGSGVYTYSWSPGTGLSSTTASNPTATPSITTTYNLTVTDNRGCSATSSVTISIHQQPSVTMGPGVTLVACGGDSAQLTATASGGTGPYSYLWSPPNNLSCTACQAPWVHNVGANSTYTVLVTDSFGCTASGTENVTVNGNGMQVNAGNDVAFCSGSSVSVTLGGSPTVTGGQSPYTYTWTASTGANPASSPNPQVTPTVTTTYTLVVTDANGCVGNDSVRITVYPKPTVVAGIPDTVCAGSQVILGGAPTASGGATPYAYSWSPGIYFITSTTIANPIVEPQANITYCVTVTDSNGCVNSACVSIQVNQNPTANAGSNLSAVSCPNSCVTLGGSPTANGGSPGYRYAWSPSTDLNNTGLSNPTACGLSVSGNYTVTVTDSKGCTASAEVSVTVTQSTLTANAGPDVSVCSGEISSVTIGGNPTAQGGAGSYTYTWSPTAGFITSNTIANPTLQPTSSGREIVIVQDALGCTAIDSMNITINPSVTASVGETDSICANGSVVIGGNPTGSGGTGNLTYRWNPGTGLSSVTIANPTASPLTTTTYCVTVTDAAGCSASACQTVIVDPAITACASPNGPLNLYECPGSYVTLGCSPTASGGSGNFSYQWSGGLIGPNPIVTGLGASTTFTVTVTDNVTGCTATASVLVNVIPSTLRANAGPDKVFCAGGSINAGLCTTLQGSASGGQLPYIFQWSTGDTIAQPCVSPLVTTTYVLTVTDGLGCESFDSVTVIVSPVIIVNPGDDTTICKGQSVVLGGNPTATGGLGSYTYTWNPQGNLSDPNGANPLASNITLTVRYHVTVTDSFGCSGTGSVAINVRSLPIVDAGNPFTLVACAGDSGQLGGNPTASGTSGPYTYQWYPQLFNAISCLTCPNPFIDSLGATTEITVVVTDSFGCVNSDSVLITVTPNTLFVNAGPTQSLCSNIGGCVTLGGNPTVFGGVPPFVYNWFGGTFSPNDEVSNPQFCPTNTTDVTVVVTDSKGCQASGSVDIIVNPPPVVSISGVPSTVCVDAGNIVMTGTPSGGTFSGPGVTGNIFQPGVVGPGTYTITYAYTDRTTGCSNDTSITVAVFALPVVGITGYTSPYCQSAAPVTLIGTPAGGVFSGPGIVGGNMFYPDSANIGNNVITYTYIDTASTGCTNTATANIVVDGNPALSLTISSDTSCNNSAVTIFPTYSIDVFNIQWSQLGGGILGAGLNPFVIHPTGTDYCVIAKAINAANCTTSDTICTVVYQPPVIPAVDSTFTCEQQHDTINLLALSTDPQASADNINIITQPAHGTITSLGSGVYVYTPGTYYYGMDTFQYASCNSQCANTCDTGTMYVHICFVNLPPIINDTTIIIYENDTAYVCPVILDQNGEPLTISDTVNCTAMNGTITFTSDSCFMFVPDSNFVGTQILCITVCDTAGICDTGTITVIVLPTNNPPLAFKIEEATCTKTPIGVDVAASTVDPDGNPMTYSYGPVQPAGGTWTVTGNGAGVFTARVPGDYRIYYTVCDSSTRPPHHLCATSFIEIIVSPCGSPLDSIFANDDGIVTDTNRHTIINELANDYYPYPDSLTVTIISGPTLPGATATVNDSTNEIDYISPTSGVDTIEYMICDPAPFCDTALIIIYVDTMPGGNAVVVYPPVAVNDFDSTNYGTPIDINVLGNDYSPDGDSIIITQIPCYPTLGTASIDSLNGTIIYTPGPGQNAYQSDTFCYVICDADYPALCDTATVVVYIRPSVFAVNDTATTCNHMGINIKALVNDYTPDNDSIWISQVITTGTVGTVTILPGGILHYVPAPDTCGFIDTFQYVDISLLGARDTATVYITVTCAPALAGVRDTVSTGLNDSVVLNPFTNDIYTGSIVGTIIGAPHHGSAHFNDDSTLVYVPATDFCGWDSIKYEGLTACGYDTSEVLINVICRTAPYAANDTEYICLQDASDQFNITVNDTAETGLTFTVTNVTAAFPSALGEITNVQTTGDTTIVTFIPNGLVSTSTFSYTICDNGSPQLCSTSYVYLHIHNCQLPIVDSIYDTTLINTPDTICVASAVVNGNGAWYLSSICDPANGTVTWTQGDSCFVYTPNTGFFGNDTFCFVICNANGCDTSEVFMTVIDTLIKAIDISCDVDTAIMNMRDTIYELANDIIPLAGDTVVSISVNPQNGVVAVNPDHSISYTPNTNYKGTDEFTYQVCAVTGTFRFCDTASVCINVVDTTHHCFIPNGFSPNGDGINDVYVIPCNDRYPESQLKVFDRWGMQVWSSNGHYNNDWDGHNQQGILCPDGTYYIIYDYNDGTTKSECKYVVISR